MRAKVPSTATELDDPPPPPHADSSSAASMARAAGRAWEGIRALRPAGSWRIINLPYDLPPKAITSGTAVEQLRFGHDSAGRLKLAAGNDLQQHITCDIVVG